MQINITRYYDRVIEWGLVVLIFLLPLIVSPWNYASYTLPQVTFLRLMTIIIIGAWLIKTIELGELRLIRSPLNLPILAFLSMATLSTFFSRYLIISLYGIYGGYQGFFTLFNYVLLCYLVLNCVKEEHLDKLIHSLFLSAGIIAIYGIFQHFGFDFLTETWTPDPARITSTLGNPIFVGAYLVLVLPLAITYFLSKDVYGLKRWFLAILILLLVLALVFTFTRAAWLGFGFALIFVLFFLRHEIYKYRRTLIVLLIILLVSFLIYFLPTRVQSPYSLLKRASSIFIPSQGGGRLALWWNVLTVIKARPILGSGPNTFLVVTSLGGIGGTHNEILNIGATLGLFGLAAYLAVVVILFFIGVRSLNQLKDNHLRKLSLGLLAGCLAYLIHMQFSFSMVSVAALFWFFIGLIFAIASPKDLPPKILKVPKFITTSSLLRWTIYAVIGLVVVSLVVFNVKPVIADIYFAKGLGLEERGYAEEAIGEYLRATNLNSHDEFYFSLLGRAYLKAALRSANQQKYYFNQAAGAFGKALSLNPNSANAHLNLGMLYAYQGFLDQAISEWKKVTAFKPDATNAHLALGFAYEQKRIFLAARQAYLKVLKLEPGNVSARQALERLKK